MGCRRETGRISSGASWPSLLSGGGGTVPGRFRDHEERGRLPRASGPRIATTRWSTSGTGSSASWCATRGSSESRPTTHSAAARSFKLVQPLVVHGGLMPTDVVSVEAGPWDERGRRPFRYVGASSNKPIRMEQAIIEIGPHIVKFRGVDGFWVGVVETGQVPRDVVTSLLSRVEQKNVDRARASRPVSDGHRLERRSQERAGPAGSRLPAGRPEGAGRECPVCSSFRARPRIGVRRCCRAARPSSTSARPSCSRRFSEKGVPTELQLEAREIERQDQQQHAADLALAAELRKLSSGAAGGRAKVLERAGDRGDQGPGRGARRRSGPIRELAQGQGRNREHPDQALFALAMSSYVAGPDHATRELAGGGGDVEGARSDSRLLARRQSRRRSSEQVAALDKLPWEAVAGASEMAQRLEILSAIIELMPPVHDDSRAGSHEDAAPPRRRGRRQRADRVRGEGSSRVSSAAKLPGGAWCCTPAKGPTRPSTSWPAEAARRGYILIAPEYMTAGRAARVSLHAERARRRPACAARRPQAVFDRQRPGLRRRPAHGGEHGLGPGAVASRPLCRRGCHLGASRQVCAPLPSSSRTHAALLRDRRSGAGGQRVHLQQV